jgi:hypothetical protein
MSGVASTYYSLDSGFAQLYTLPVAVSGDGTHTIAYYSVDAAGNAEATKTATVRIDTTAPVTTDDAPTGWMSGTVNVHLGSTDAASGVAHTYYSTDGSAPSIEATGAIVITAEGTTTVLYRSADAVGNLEATKTATVRIDDTAPVSTDDAPTGWVSGTVNVHLGATDSASGVAHTHYSTDGSAPSIEATGAIVITAEGTTTVLYRSTDAIGNVEATKTATVRIDNTAPVSSSDATSTYADVATITVQPTDIGGSGVANTYTRVDQGTWTTGTVAVASTLGTHTVDFYSIDNVSHRETTRTVSFLIVAGITRYEQSDSRLAYQGTWTQASATPFSGGSLKYTDTTGSCVDIAFNGTLLNLIALKGPQYGKAKITLDATSTWTVDLYAPTYTYQAEIWTSGTLTSGDHTVRVEWTGLKSPSSSGARIDLDAIDINGELRTAVPGPPPTTRYEQADALVTYQQPWSLISGGNYSGGNLRYSNTPTATVNTAFTGTRVSLVSLTGPNYGIAKVTVDGQAPVNVDLYSADYAFKQVVWTSPALADTSHTLKVEWTGSKNASSTATQINVDAFDVVGTLIRRRVEQGDSLINFLKPWTTTSASGYSGGSLKYVDLSGAAANITFTGNQIGLVSLTGPNYGIARVIVDGGTPETVDLYSASYAYKQLVWSKTALADTQHTLTVEWTGSKNTSSTGTQINFDAVDVSGVLISRRYEQGDPLITYRKTWSTGSGASYSGLTIASVDATDAAADFAFSGTKAEIFTLTGPNYGIAEVVLDSGTPVLVDMYSPGYSYKKLAWSSGQLTDGYHTVSMRRTGTKNASSSGTQIAFDAVDIVGILQTHRFEDANTSLRYLPAWSTGTGAFYSGGNVHYTNVASSTLNVAFSGTSLNLISLTGPNNGIMRVTLDGTRTTLVDLYTSAYIYNQSVWASGQLADGPHNLLIEWTGTKNAASSATQINIDALDGVAVLTPADTPQRFEQTDTRIAYSGEWTPVTGVTGASGSSFAFSTATTSVATIKFNGTSVALLSLKAPIYGFASLSLDGGEPTLVNLYAADWQFKQTIFSASGLPNATHTLTVTPAGTKDPASGGYRVGVDAVDVVGDLMQAP